MNNLNELIFVLMKYFLGKWNFIQASDLNVTGSVCLVESHS